MIILGSLDFLLVLMELFSLGVTAEALRANIGSKSAISLQREPVDPKFQVEEVAPANHSSSQKIRLTDLSYGITRYSSADEIANVNFLRRHRTRTTKYKKEDKNKQLSSR